MAMLKVYNKKFKYKNKEYEVVWISDFALHIMKRYEDPSHLIDHLQIELFATKAIYFPFKKNYHIGIGLFNGKYYQVVVHFNEPTKRCIVKTCYCVKDLPILQLCKEFL